MQTTRRTLLKGGGLAALLAGAGMGGGCTFPLPTEENSYGTWFFEPSAYVAAEAEVFATVDVAHLSENRENLPRELFHELEDLDREFRSVDVFDLDRALGIGFGSKAEHDLRGGFVTVLEGTFDPDEIIWELRDLSDEEDVRLEYSEYEDFELVGPEEEDSRVDIPSIELGLSEDILLVGVTYRSRLDARRAIEAAIDAEQGDEDRYVESNENAELIVDELSGSTVLVGIDIERQLVHDFLQDVDRRPVHRAFEDVDAIGFGATVEEEVTSIQVMLIYKDVASASEEYGETLLDIAREEDDEVVELIDDIEITENGRAVILGGEIENVELRNEFELNQAPLHVASFRNPIMGSPK